MAAQRRLAPGGAYSESVVVEGPGKWIHVAGHIGVDDNGNLVSGGVYEEAVATFDGIRRALEAVGATLGDVVRIGAFLTSPDDDADFDREYADFSRARSEAFGDELPASATVTVSKLYMGARVEVWAIAFLEDTR